MRKIKIIFTVYIDLNTNYLIVLVIIILMCNLTFLKIIKISNINRFSYLIVIVMYITKYDFRIIKRYQHSQSLKYENKGFAK